jgi:hypothetical protein
MNGVTFNTKPAIGGHRAYARYPPTLLIVAKITIGWDYSVDYLNVKLPDPGSKVISTVCEALS